VIKSPSNELAELTTLSKTLIVIISWTSLHDEIKVGIKAAIGGVEAIGRVLQSFPKCHDLQWRGCCAGVSQDFAKAERPSTVSKGMERTEEMQMIASNVSSSGSSLGRIGTIELLVILLFGYLNMCKLVVIDW
jgi:hypothetical protein